MSEPRPSRSLSHSQSHSRSRSSSGGLEMAPSTRRVDPILPPAVDLGLLDYADDVDPHLICPVCQSAFVDPVQLRCDHTFCRPCLARCFAVLGPSQPPTTATGTQSSARACPTCRAPVDLRTYERDRKNRPPPRYVVQMLDALRVNCPNRRAGCGEVVTRGGVDDHVRRYCDFTLVRCPEYRSDGGDEDDNSTAGCAEMVSRRDSRAGKCLHRTEKCDDCGEKVMMLERDHHDRDLCPNRYRECRYCDQMMAKPDVDEHVKNACPIAPVPCPGHAFGCVFKDRRDAVAGHAGTCPIALMAPHLESQAREQRESAAKIGHLERKVAMLENGLSSIQDLLYTAPRPPPLASTSTAAATTTTATSSVIGSPAMSPVPVPFDTPASHLLSLHESLRAELSHLESALAELDSRTTMMVMTESVRTKESMAHTNAAINGMRVQLHWLMSANLHDRAVARPKQSQQQQQQSAGPAFPQRPPPPPPGSQMWGPGARPGMVRSGTATPAYAALAGVRTRSWADFGRSDVKL